MIPSRATRPRRQSPPRRFTGRFLGERIDDVKKLHNNLQQRRRNIRYSFNPREPPVEDLLLWLRDYAVCGTELEDLISMNMTCFNCRVHNKLVDHQEDLEEALEDIESMIDRDRTRREEQNMWDRIDRATEESRRAERQFEEQRQRLLRERQAQIESDDEEMAALERIREAIDSIGVPSPPSITPNAAAASQQAANMNTNQDATLFSVLDDNSGNPLYFLDSLDVAAVGGVPMERGNGQASGPVAGAPLTAPDMASTANANVQAEDEEIQAVEFRQQ